MKGEELRCSLVDAQTTEKTDMQWSYLDNEFVLF